MSPDGPSVIIIGSTGALLIPAIHTLAREADLVLVATDSPTPMDPPDAPTLSHVVEMAMIETLKDIDGIRLDLQGPDMPEERMNSPRQVGRIVDNAEATGANGHAARALDYGPAILLAGTARTQTDGRRAIFMPARTCAVFAHFNP